MRGNPRPPLKDTYIGRGKPSYRDAVKDIDVKIPGRRNKTDEIKEESDDKE